MSDNANDIISKSVRFAFQRRDVEGPFWPTVRRAMLNDIRAAAEKEMDEAIRKRGWVESK